MKNDTIVVEQNQSEPIGSLVKSSMSRTLVYRTNKEFDKCAELLRNILTVQESRRNSKSSIIGEIHRKSQQSSPIINRTKKANPKISSNKCSSIKPNFNSDFIERRSSFSPTKSLISSTQEDSSLIKTRSSPTKILKHSTRSSSPSINHHQRLSSPSKNSSSTINKTRQKTSPSPSNRSSQIRQQRSKPVRIEREIVRSSSCGDLTSMSFLQKQQTRFIIEQFVEHLIRIRTISKQIRIRNSNTIHDSESFRLWNELENSLSSALSYANDDIQYQLSLEPLRNEIFQLRKQLKEFDYRRQDNLYNFNQKNFENNSHQFSQLILENQDLKNQCYSLQEKLENLERTNLRLIQRSTQKDLRSLAEKNEPNFNENRLVLREEILLLKQKLYHLYDDLATLFNRNRSLEQSNVEQKQQLINYKQQISHIQKSAQHLLNDLEKKTTEDKIKRFLNEILLDQQPNGSQISSSHFHSLHMTTPKSTSGLINTSIEHLETPQKLIGFNGNHIQATIDSRQSATIPKTTATTTTKLRPKSLFITPTILNDATALSKLQQSRTSIPDQSFLTPCSSSTICDAESILASSSSSSSSSSSLFSLYHQQAKRMTLYTSLPTLNISSMVDESKVEPTFVHHQACFDLNANESGPEMDQISDLTSKMFSSEEEEEDNDDQDEDIGIGISNTSTSSLSTIPSDAERLVQM